MLSDLNKLINQIKNLSSEEISDIYIFTNDILCLNEKEIIKNYENYYKNFSEKLPELFKKLRELFEFINNNIDKFININEPNDIYLIRSKYINLKQAKDVIDSKIEKLCIYCTILNQQNNNDEENKKMHEKCIFKKSYIECIDILEILLEKVNKIGNELYKEYKKNIPIKENKNIPEVFKLGDYQKKFVN